MENGDNFRTVYGTAGLALGTEVVPIRLALDTFDNTFQCSGQSNMGSSVNWGEVDTLRLIDVELIGDGVKWSTPEIKGLQVLNVQHRGWSIGDSELGAITGQNTYATRFKLSKNGQHIFDLDGDFEHAVEFSGGLKLMKPVELETGIYFYSDGNRSLLSGPQAHNFCIDAEISALAIACGTLLVPRFEISGRTLKMTFWQALVEQAPKMIFDDSKDGYHNLENRAQYFCKVFNSAKKRLEYVPEGSRASIGELVNLFLHCRSMTNVLDIQLLSLFTFFEAVDGSRTLSGNTLCRLLQVSEDIAKELIQVRNKVSHGTHNLSDAVTEFVDLNDKIYSEFAQGRLSGNSSAVTLINFLHYQANSVFLRLIGVDVPIGSPYPRRKI